MQIWKSHQSLMASYDISETEARDIWKKSHWHSVLHPISLIVLIGGFFLKYFIFFEKLDVFVFGFISIQNSYVALVVLIYIFLCHFFRLNYINKKLFDKRKSV